MPSTCTPVRPQSQSIHRLAGIADTIGALLAAFALLPVEGQNDALAVSASLADELAKELGAIAREAA